MSEFTESLSAEAKLAPTLAAPEAELPMEAIRRTGTVSKFDASKISVAMTKAFLAVEAHSRSVRRVPAPSSSSTAEWSARSHAG